MFESPVEKEPSSRKEMMIVVAIVVVLAVAGFAAYMHFAGGGTASTPSAQSAATAVPAGVKPDPVHDLRIVSTKMDKDPTGTTAVWLVEIRNDSRYFTYSKISYQTTYAGADNSVIAQNKGVIPLTIGPGEDQTPTINDVLYPTGTAIYKFQILDATSSTQ